MPPVPQKGLQCPPITTFRLETVAGFEEGAASRMIYILPDHAEDTMWFIQLPRLVEAGIPPVPQKGFQCPPITAFGLQKQLHPYGSLDLLVFPLLWVSHMVLIHRGWFFKSPLSR